MDPRSAAHSQRAIRISNSPEVLYANHERDMTTMGASNFRGLREARMQMAFSKYPPVEDATNLGLARRVGR